MEAVRALGFDALMREHVEAGRPALGICLGMQLLFESSSELGGAEGLGLLEGDVAELDAPGLKVPHIGWNEVAWTADHPFVEGLPDGTRFYFVHSYAPDRDGSTVGVTEHGRRFAAVAARGNVFATQFHPEKSGDAGLTIYANLVKAVAS
jgi:glutamine amidotransferase